MILLRIIIAYIYHVFKLFNHILDIFKTFSYYILEAISLHIEGGDFMYCPNNSENRSIRCTTRCCMLYNFALAFLAALILAVIGLILGVNFAVTLAGSLPLLIASVVILFVFFLTKSLTKIYQCDIIGDSFDL